MKDRAAASAARRVDAAHLPDELVALLTALAPGEALTVLRDGEPIATITGAAGSGPLEGTIFPGQGKHAGRTAPDEQARDRTARPDVTVVVTAMKLSETVRGRLSGELGSDYIVLDLDVAPDTAEVLLVPPISLQLLDSLRARFPAARVIVAEFEDPELGVDYRGPVQRMIDAGAEAYLASTTLTRLAAQLEKTVSRRPGPALGSSQEYPRLEIGPPA
ncbi:hypothetical protein [Catenulispora subtropica]|uniref:Response regulator receiver protein n=1 Tax=Catenulispora subtropica TaxID=450798 RepID=A0ABN2RCH0_9ACTN